MRVSDAMQDRHQGSFCTKEPTFILEGPCGPLGWRYVLHCEDCADVDGPPSAWSEKHLLDTVTAWNELNALE